ncbi:poly(ethylene terephthalate) hydrolase family protein [Anaerosporobacter sp.]|uniref:poly(ethylene terephthalate) hydrolase family protein n=1 Tax=Anaerosporobacter sp. TaxID=1872529 RepID=UPI00286EED6A|nr:chlorophyllase [Anaerosporobacter sp.]
MEKEKKFQKIKDVRNKIVIVIKKIWHIFSSYWKRSFEDTYRGLAICSVLFSAVSIAVGLEMYFSPLNINGILFCLAGFIGASILFPLLFLATKILFGSSRKGVIYWFVPFFLLYTVASMINSQEVAVFFAAITLICIDFFGRSMWAIIKQRRRTITPFVTLIIAVLGLGGISVFLVNEGFKDKYIESYLSMKEENVIEGKQSKEKEVFANAIAKGSYETTSLEYGIGDSYDLQSSTYNLSSFAQRSSIAGWVMKQHFGYDLEKVPVTGKVWYPVTENKCPVLYIVHGNHSYTTQSYLGYDYLGEYLASNGYVVVSVNENCCNELSDENDARAILLLENIEQVLQYNKEENNPLYNKIAEESIAIAGHSRGGECVSTAYLFNNYSHYPDNGNIRFHYNFSIKSILAIAPTADQYMPAQHEVSITDVNYLLIHGVNDQDVQTVMGNKLYKNTTFSGEGDFFKSAIYIAGANHGQFNSEWGRYDMGFPLKYFLNVKNMIAVEEQEDILKIFTKIFLDVTLKQDTTNKDLFNNYLAYESYLPKTIYQQMYQNSSFECVSDFEEDSDLTTATMEGATISVLHTRVWEEMKTAYGDGGTKENYVLRMKWKNTSMATVKFKIPSYDMTGKNLQFDIADLQEEEIQTQLIDGTVRITDSFNHVANVKISDCAIIYPTLPVQLYKVSFLMNEYEYKHQMQTVSMKEEQFLADNPEIKTNNITSIEIIFDCMEYGNIKIDNVGFEKNR